MKRMKDESAEKGVKILGMFKFVERGFGSIWELYELRGDCYYFVGRLPIKKNQPNYKLYEKSLKYYWDLKTK